MQKISIKRELYQEKFRGLFHGEPSLTQKKRKGNLGEQVARRFLKGHQYKIIDRNYAKKWGEIDIIASKDGDLHFVEVKTVSYETNYSDVAPEEAILYASEHADKFKWRRLERTVASYLLEGGWHERGENRDWHMDLVVVLLDLKDRVAVIEMFEDVSYET